MQIRRVLHGAALFAATAAEVLALSGCGGGGSSTPSTSEPPTPVTTQAAYTNPPLQSPVGVPAWNISGISTTRTGAVGSTRYNQLQVAVTFANTNVGSALPAPGQMITPAQIGVNLYFNSHTLTVVNESVCGFLDHSAPPVSADIYMDGGTFVNRNLNGSFGIFEISSSLPAGYVATVSPNGKTLTYTLPIPATSSTNGAYALTVAVFSGASPEGAGSVTDCEPRNGAVITT